MRILIWNLFHGRSLPAAGRDLQEDFASALAGWRWDVALLQEVPPWWPPALASACDADARSALTSRNALPALRRALGRRLPDVIRSNAGGANAILVRRRGAAAGAAGGTADGDAAPDGGSRILEHRSLLLRRRPERRVCHAVALDDGTWCANLHAQVHSPERAQADIERAAVATLSWAQGAPAVLGGDFNVRSPRAAGFELLGGNGVDHVLGSGMAACAPAELPDRGGLSDHAAVIVTVLPRAHRAAG